jgi:dihydroflavonol-4-reductase
MEELPPPPASSDKVNVIVTGGTGFFGHNLVLALLKDPRVDRIHVYARNPPPTENRLSAWGVDGRNLCGHKTEPCSDEERVFQSGDRNAVFDNERVYFFPGDICDRDALIHAAEGCTIMFHACGDTRWWNAKDEEQRRTNVEGTANAANVTLMSRTIKRFIYTSTVDVMGHWDPDNYKGGSVMCNGNKPELDETWDIWDYNSYAKFGYNYADTKRRAEFVLESMRGMFQLDGKRVTIIRPGSMLGPWDVSNQYGRLFAELKQRSLAGIPCGGTSVCHVEDVAQAHIAAAFAPVLVQGAVYICAGINMSYRRLFLAMRRMLRDYRDNNDEPIGFCCGPYYEVIPGWILTLYGWGCEQYANRWSGNKPELNPGMARYMSCNAFYCSDKAQHDLDYPDQEQRWVEAIGESYYWYRCRGRF